MQTTRVHPQPVSYSYIRRHSRRARQKSLIATATAAAKQQAPDVQQLSTILLVNENLKRRICRGLLEPDQLLQAVELVDKANYVLVVARAPDNTTNIQQQLHHPGQCQTAYANAAGVQLLCQHGQQQLESISLPSAIAADWQAAGTASQQQQQQSPCRTFEAVPWRYAGDQHLTVDKMLVCPVDAPDGTYLGLALIFDRWSHPLDGSIGAPGHPRVQLSELPTQQQLQQAADAVRQQADVVRQLKQGHGLGNKDSRVVAAVAQLQQLKEQLGRLDSLQSVFHSDKQGLMQQLMESCHSMTMKLPAEAQQ